MIKKRPVFYILAFNLFLFIINLVFAQTAFLQNIKLAVVSEDLDRLEQKNKELRVQVAKAESVELIVKKAKEQGFVENPTILYISSPKLARND